MCLNRAERSFEWCEENIQRFVDRIPENLAVTQLKPYYVTQTMASFPDWSNNNKNTFMSALKHASNWAVEEERIDRNPLERMMKPGREAREMAVSAAEYRVIIDAITEPRFRDLVELS